MFRLKIGPKHGLIFVIFFKSIIVKNISIFTVNKKIPHSVVLAERDGFEALE